MSMMAMKPNVDTAAIWQKRKSQQLHRIASSIKLSKAVWLGAASGLRAEPIVLLDVGARGGLARSWSTLSKLGLVRPVFVEPEEEAALKLRNQNKNATVIESAFGARNENRTLYVTSHRGCTSILEPLPRPQLPAFLQSMYEVDSQNIVSVTAARDELLERSIQPEVVKLDVQGFELEILRGLGEILASVIAVEVEVSFVATYHEQPLFQEIHEFMTANGFGLIEIRAFGVAATGCAVQANAYYGNRTMNTQRSRIVEDIFALASGVGFSA